ncbi:MAG TPA: TraB/GumN family protein [Candidatus Angelobacter sp.]
METKHVLTMVRKHKILFLFVAVFLTAVQAWTQAAPQPDAKAHRLLMWKATSPTNTVYLLGSIHAGDKEFYPLPDVVESAFNNSKLLVVEVNVKNVNPMAGMKLVQQYGVYPENDALSKHLSRATADALDAYCSKHGLPRALLEKFKPWMAALTIEVMAVQQAGEDLQMGIDLHFLNESKEPQKIEELETADFQMTALSSGSEEEQQEFLAQTLKHAENTKERLGSMRKAFLNGDADTIEKMLEEDNEPKSLYKRLVDDRNGPMAERIAAYLNGKDQCFVVVGAGHLVGEKGIIRQLRDKNFKVEQMSR